MNYPRFVCTTIFSIAITMAAITTAAITYAATAQDARRKGPIIRQLDHILVESTDPESLFRLFSDTLQLPVAWPLADSQGFLSGGVGAGNVNIEFYRYAQQNAPAPKALEARYAGLAFQPYPLPDALRELRVSGIPYDPPEPYVSALPDGSQGTLWTTVPLPSFSRPEITVFLYEYSPAFLKVEARRQQLGNRLALNNGGPLGVQFVREMVVAARNYEADKAAWEQLLEKKTTSGDQPFGTGPSIRLVPGSRDSISEMILAVKSVGRAKEFLAKNGLLGAESPGEISLDPSKVQGLKIRLME